MARRSSLRKFLWYAFLAGTLLAAGFTLYLDIRVRRERARGGVGYLVREQPLALGAIGLAVGAVLAAMAPRTQKEEELMGEASRSLMEKAKETGAQQLEKAQETVKQVVENASSEGRLQTQGQSVSQPPQQEQKKPHVQPRTPPQTQPPRQNPGPTASGPDKKGAW